MRTLFPYTTLFRSVEGPKGIWFGAPAINISDDKRKARFTIPFKSGAEKLSEQTPLRFTLLNRKTDSPQMTAVEISIKIDGIADEPASEVPWDKSTVLFALIFAPSLAVLGGFILNFMPCVLPVLSLKLLQITKNRGASSKDVRIGFLWSCAGIMTSMWLLAFLLVVIKLSGGVVGWGVQFQQPVFLSFILCILVIFAASLFGLISFQLPGFLQAKLLYRPHGGNEKTRAHVESFLSGAFVTLLATPCSAPFLGTAIGFALSRGILEIGVIFSALGLGLSLPWLLVALHPPLIRLLPEPGPWMKKLQYFLALLLMGTAIWIMSVLSVTLGWGNTGFVALLAVIAVMAMGKISFFPTFGRTFIGMIFIITAIASPLLLNDKVGNPVAQKEKSTGPIDWQNFDEEKIRHFVANGKIVFVDIWADWCVTCEWNKQTVIHDEEIVKKLNGDGVVAMQADWTKPDPLIAKYLARHGRYGLPFDIVYGPTAPSGILLPELLTKSRVLKALNKAKN